MALNPLVSMTNKSMPVKLYKASLLSYAIWPGSIKLAYYILISLKLVMDPSKIKSRTGPFLKFRIVHFVDAVLSYLFIFSNAILHFWKIHVLEYEYMHFNGNASRQEKGHQTDQIKDISLFTSFLKTESP